MHNKIIFERALRKAQKNGFNLSGGPNILLDPEPIFEGFEFLKYKRIVMVQVDSMCATYFGLDSIIFSHDFAKAFWGEEEQTREVCQYEVESENDTKFIGKKPLMKWIIKMPVWKFELQQMVLEEEPLKYLERFL